MASTGSGARACVAELERTFSGSALVPPGGVLEATEGCAEGIPIGTIFQLRGAKTL